MSDNEVEKMTTAPSTVGLIQADFLQQLKDEVRQARHTAVRQVNSSMIQMYWRLGKMIDDRANKEAWGSGAIRQIAEELSREFPDSKGFSFSNIKYMRQFAILWEEPIGQQPVGQLPWGHVIALMSKLSSVEARDWYAAKATEHGWSRSVLEHQIATNLKSRTENKPVNNFTQILAPVDSELALDMLKEPYFFEHVSQEEAATERSVEDALANQIEKTMRELGTGFTYRSRQEHFEVDGEDFYTDLIFFNTELNAYVVVELKITNFKPDHLGQLNFYVNVIDEQLRRPHHNPTMGLLLCTGGSAKIRQLAMTGMTGALAVSSYERGAANEELSKLLPSPDQLNDALNTASPEEIQ